MDKKYKPQSEYDRDLSAEETADDVLSGNEAGVLPDSDNEQNIRPIRPDMNEVEGPRFSDDTDLGSGVRQAKIQMTPRKEYIPSSEGLEEFNLQIEGDTDDLEDSDDNNTNDADFSPKNNNEGSNNKKVLNASDDIFKKRDKRVVVLEILDWIKYILIAIILGLLISKFVIQRSEVVGRSMEDTLHDEDQLVVDKLTLLFSSPERGDIVTVNGAKAHNDNKEVGMLVKRVVALPGDTLDFKDGKVIINGQEIEEDYLSAGTYTMAPFGWQGEIRIPEGHYYVLGDNRGNSADSRVFGPVPENAIEGKVWIRIYPFDKFGKLD